MTKVAIPRYAGRIAPRFGFTEDILLVELSESGSALRKVISARNHLPHDIPELLAGEGVRVVLTGGINHQFQSLFQSYGIDVIWGLIGTPEDALEAFLTGGLSPGMGRCPEGRRRQSRHGQGRHGQGRRKRLKGGDDVA